MYVFMYVCYLNGALLADVALGLVARRLGSDEAVQHRQPHHALRLLLHPVQEMRRLQGSGSTKNLQASF
jgi:hypothetical protein